MVAFVFLLLSIPLLTGSTSNKQAQRDVLVKCVKFVKAKVICFIYIIMLSEETIICFQVFIPTFLKAFVAFMNRVQNGGSTGACIVKTVRMYRIRMHVFESFFCSECS